MDIFNDTEICKNLALRELRRFGVLVRRHCVNFEDLLEHQYHDSNHQVNNFLQKPEDGVSSILLVKTGSPAFDKIILSLSSICLEIDNLVDTNDFVRLICEYGELDEAPEVQLSKFVPTLRRLKAYVSRCAEAIQLAVNQVSGLCSLSPQNESSTTTVIFSKLSRLCVALTALDSSMCQQSVLQEHVQIYMRLLKSWKYDPKLSEQIKSLLKLLTDINAEIMRGSILKDCVRKIYVGDPKFSERLKDTIRQYLAELESTVADSQTQIFLRSEKFVAASCLFLLLFTIRQQADRQLFKMIVDISKKIGAVSLPGNVVWDAQSFFAREIPALGSLFPAQSTSSAHLAQMLCTLPQDVHKFENQVALWLLRMDAAFGKTEDDHSIETLKTKCTLLLNALNISRCLNQQLSLTVSLHVSAKKTMTKLTVISMAKLICAFCALKSTLCTYQSQIDEGIALIDQYLHYQLLENVTKIRQRMTQEKKTDKRKLDANAALKLAEATLKGPYTKLKEICVNIAKEFIIQVKIVRPDEAKILNSNLKRLSLIANYSRTFQKDMDMWNLSNHHISLLEVSLTQMYKNLSSVTNSSSAPMIETVTRKRKFECSVKKIIDESLTDQLCKDIENDLRIQMHTHLMADSRNPFKQPKPRIQSQLRRICLNNFSLPTEKVSLKRQVEQYLERIFYNLTTVALHDWGTYDEMRVIAELKFGARTVESYLPAETLDQGLDVLTIIRNIDSFSSKYVHNMNNQTFVERVSANKYLNTVNIGHIANSIRTHGPGITNTTVNVAYRFLRNQFKVLSQLLHNEHIKSNLIRNINHFQETKETLQQKYPYSKAEKLSKSMRNLGATQEGFTYLDKFRQILTSVGNAMGYIRMMRNGALEYCAQGNSVLSDVTCDNDESFCRSAEDSRFENCSEVIGATQRLDALVSSLLQQQSGVEGTDYYKLLVNAFEGPFSDVRNSYLQNFYILVPSLTLNFVEHIVRSRERLSRKNKNDAIFSDDGFAIGIAFALRLTRQFGSFDSLHWFSSVDEKYLEELKTNQAASRSPAMDEKLSQTISLTEKRIEAYRKEFSLLHHAFTSARIFFKTS